MIDDFISKNLLSKLLESFEFPPVHYAKEEPEERKAENRLEQH